MVWSFKLMDSENKNIFQKMQNLPNILKDDFQYFVWLKYLSVEQKERALENLLLKMEAARNQPSLIVLRQEAFFLLERLDEFEIQDITKRQKFYMKIFSFNLTIQSDPEQKIAACNLMLEKGIKLSVILEWIKPYLFENNYNHLLWFQTRFRALHFDMAKQQDKKRLSVKYHVFLDFLNVYLIGALKISDQPASKNSVNRVLSPLKQIYGKLENGLLQKTIRYLSNTLIPHTFEAYVFHYPSKEAETESADSVQNRNKNPRFLDVFLHFWGGSFEQNWWNQQFFQNYQISLGLQKKILAIFLDLNQKFSLESNRFNLAAFRILYTQIMNQSQSRVAPDTAQIEKWIQEALFYLLCLMSLESGNSKKIKLNQLSLVGVEREFSKKIRLECTFQEFKEQFGSWTHLTDLIYFFHRTQTYSKVDHMPHLENWMKSYLKGNEKSWRYDPVRNPQLGKVKASSFVNINRQTILGETVYEEWTKNEQALFVQSADPQLYSHQEFKERCEALKRMILLGEYRLENNEQVELLKKQKDSLAQILGEMENLSEYNFTVGHLSDGKTLEVRLKEIRNHILSFRKWTLKHCENNGMDLENDFQQWIIEMDDLIDLTGKSAKVISQDSWVEETDHGNDLISCGELPGSCLSMSRNQHLETQFLIGYLVHGHVKMIVHRLANGDYSSRAIMRLMLDENSRPVLYLENIYSKEFLNVDAKTRADNQMVMLAMMKALKIGIPIKLSRKLGFPQSRLDEIEKEAQAHFPGQKLEVFKGAVKAYGTPTYEKVDGSQIISSMGGDYEIP